jgi:hypothetical protein
MLKFEEKIDILKNHLSTIEDNYADSFKTDIFFYFGDFNINDGKLNFLNNLISENEINQWVNNLTSKIVLKFNEEEEELSDFIFYSTN